MRGKLLILAAGVFSFECVTLHINVTPLSRHELITKVLICSSLAWPNWIIDTVLCSLSALTQFYIQQSRLKHNKDAVLTDSKLEHFYINEMMK